MASKYRYTLTRDLDPENPKRMCWVMLNPSTATENLDDPTIRKVKYFTAREGYGKIIVVNLFALRATKPGALLTAEDPKGPMNANCIEQHMKRSDAVVFAWGAWWSNVPLSKRPSRIAPEFYARRQGIQPLCLGTTADGSPRHPCYLAHATEFEPFPL